MHAFFDSTLLWLYYAFILLIFHAIIVWLYSVTLLYYSLTLLFFYSAISLVYRKFLNETSFDNSKYVLYDPMSLFHGRWQQGEPVKQPQKYIVTYCIFMSF